MVIVMGSCSPKKTDGSGFNGISILSWIVVIALALQKKIKVQPYHSSLKIRPIRVG